MNLHGRIMNLPTDPDNLETAATKPPQECYRVGHRDARHAAAELAMKADAAMREAAQIINELCQCYGHPTPDATLARLLGDVQRLS